MGQKSSTQEIDPDVITAREHHSSTLEEYRERRLSIYSSMYLRTLHKSIDAYKPKLDISLLPNEVLFLILKFLASDVRMLLAVSPSWYVRIIEAFDEMFNPIESHFALVHSHMFTFEKGFLSSSYISVSEHKGYRVDRAIVAEPLIALQGKTIKFRYTYRTYQSDYIYKAEFKFDAIKPKKLDIWLHKDDSRVNGNDNNRAYGKQISEICCGDKIEFAIN